MSVESVLATMKVASPAELVVCPPFGFGGSADPTKASAHSREASEIWCAYDPASGRSMSITRAEFSALLAAGARQSTVPEAEAMRSERWEREDEA